MANHYTLLKRYASRFDENIARDIVHSLWLRYYEKTGRDFLTEDLPRSYLFKAVKNEYLNQTYLERKYHQEPLESDDIMMVDDLSVESDASYLAVDEDFSENFDLEVIAAVHHEKIERLITTKKKNSNAPVRPEVYWEVFDLMQKAYNPVEMVDVLNISKRMAWYYTTAIRKCLLN